MARGLNKVMLIGNCGKDPEVKYMPSGDAVASVSIATSETWKDKETGEKKENTEWHNIVFFKKLAEVVGEYVRKGSKIYVEGKLKTRKWQDKDGNDRWTTEIVCHDMQMLDSKGGGGGSQQGPSGAQAYSQAKGGGAGGKSPAPPEAGFDDDIPF